MYNKFDNMMKMEILSKSQNEAFARMAVSAFIAQLDPTLEELSDIKTAVSEAVTNSIIHGYEERQDAVIKICCSYEDNNVEIEISDMGKGINDLELAMQPLYTSRPDLERSGMGFTVMQTFMDEVNVVSHIGEGTRVIMKKTIQSAKNKAR